MSRTGPGGVAEGKVCLCADLGFDGRWLDPQPLLADLPSWWSLLLGQETSVRAADGDAARAMFEEGAVHELCLRLRPYVGGSSGLGTLSGSAGHEPFFARSLVWTLLRMETTSGGDCLLHYRRVQD